MKYILLIVCFWQLILCAKPYDTFYGSIDVQEPVLIELIESAPFQRLKHIHQYGVSYYTTHREEYTRYAHSMGVFVILRKHGASLKEQIAGLLHDVSHTVFSHVGDWIFAREYQEIDYQNSIHQTYLERTSLGKILAGHGYCAEELLPTEDRFPALEQKRPNLSADRIDYNIQGAYFQNFISKQEALEIVDDLAYVNGNWVATKEDLMAKLVRFSLFMTQDCWSSPRNYVASRWLADAILRLVDMGCLSMNDIHYGTDQVVWEKLNSCTDATVCQLMQQVVQADEFFQLASPEESDWIVKSKFRAIDPWILKEGKLVRLTSIDAKLCAEYETVKETIARGWPIQVKKGAVNNTLLR